MAVTEAEPLDERKQSILKAIVHDYTSTAEPVSSEMLAYRYRLGVKPATIRNEMAEMSEMGYLRQPHTSAGRVPSDLGYRFYVDRLMSGPGLSSSEEDGVTQRYLDAVGEIEGLLQVTCRILAALTHHASMAVEPSCSETTVRHINLSMIDPRKLLLALVTSDGRVQHSFVDLANAASHSKVSRLSTVLSQQHCGQAIESLLAGGMDVAPSEALGMEDEYRAAARALRQLARQVRYGDLLLDGTANILSEPEFRNVTKLGLLLTAFEDRRALLEPLGEAMRGEGTAIVIGAENPHHEMRDCSFVTTTYRIGRRSCGAIGVIGPTRMNYHRAVSAVNLLAQNLSEALTAMSIG